ncbi:MAG: LPS export ABC transporter periplasmic protein LptC [Gemmatimonadota bacterium]
MRVVGAMVLAMALVSCRDSGEPPLVAEEVLQLNEKANQVVFGLDHYVTNQGVRRAHIKADTAFFLENESVVELRVMEVTFFDAMGDTTSILTAQEGTYDWSTSNMTAAIDVVVISPREGRRVETSVLNYNSAMDRIWGDQPTTIIEADGTVVEGTAFETNARMDRVDLTSARIVRPGSQPQREP